MLPRTAAIRVFPIPGQQKSLMLGMVQHTAGGARGVEEIFLKYRQHNLTQTIKQGGFSGEESSISLQLCCSSVTNPSKGGVPPGPSLPHATGASRVIHRTAPTPAHTLTQPSHTADPRACGPCLLLLARDANHRTQECPPPAPMRPGPRDKHST